MEVEIVGWGKDYESWSIEYHKLYGDPSSPNLWTDLDRVLQRRWPHAIQGKINITASCIDTGGHHTQSVYAYCKKRYGDRVFAIKGVGGEGKPIVGKPSKNNIGKVKLFPVGVDTAKELVYSRLQIQDAGPGYCHFPENYDEEYFKQLTAEQVITKYHKGFKRREWQKIRPRNEALDCRVYALAALSITNIDVNMLAERKQKKQEEVEPEQQKVRQAQRAYRSRNNFVNRWR